MIKTRQSHFNSSAYFDFRKKIITTRSLISISTTPCCVYENVQEISGGSAGDSKIEDHEGRCLSLKGINSFAA